MTIFRQIIDRLRGFKCSKQEARIIYYFAFGFRLGAPGDEAVRAIRRDPDPEALAMVRRNLDPRLLADRP